MIAEWDFAEEVVKNEPQIIEDVEQGSEEWLAIRAGNITGSRIHCMMAGGDGKTKDKYRIQLAIERITGKPVTMDFKSRAMIKGNADEPLARDHYEFINDVDSRQVTFVYHPTIKNAGVSPDSLIGDDGLLEIKCPNIETHVGYLITKKIPRAYMLQMTWEMACTGRKWCDFVSYSKEMPIHLRALVIRVNRDEEKISELEQAAIKFNNEVDELVKLLGEYQ
jgi:putative phage-type endonuclease